MLTSQKGVHRSDMRSSENLEQQQAKGQDARDITLETIIHCSKQGSQRQLTDDEDCTVEPFLSTSTGLRY
jgi:hypothetical protein